VEGADRIFVIPSCTEWPELDHFDRVVLIILGIFSQCSAIEIIIIIIIIVRSHLFQPHLADQMPGHQEMGQLLELELRPCLGTHGWI